MNVIVVDNENSIEIISSALKEIEGVFLMNTYGSIDEVDDVKNVDIIIFDVDSKNSGDVLKKVENLAYNNKRLNFIATSYEINSELVVEILKTQGVKEFILKPIIKSILVNAVKKIEDIKNKIVSKKANTVAIYSSKGATGKTSLATNVAYELQSMTKEKVCILDFNYGDCLTFLNINPKFDSNYVIKNIETSDRDLFFSLIDRFQESDLYLFCPNINLKTNYSKETLIKIINYFKTFFSYIIVDLPSNIDEKTASLITNCDMTLLMCVYNLISIRNTQQCLNFFDDIGYDKNRVNLIINRYTQNTDLTLLDVKKTLDKEVFYKIPNNYITINDAIERGLPLQITNPNSNIYKAYRSLAQNIINTDFEDLRTNNPNINHGIFNLIRRMGE